MHLSLTASFCAFFSLSLPAACCHLLCLSAFLFLSESLSLSLSQSSSLSLIGPLSFSLPVSVADCFFQTLRVSHSLSVCRSVCQSVCLSVCLSLFLSLSPFSLRPPPPPPSSISAFITICVSVLDSGTIRFSFELPSPPPRPAGPLVKASTSRAPDLVFDSCLR